MDDVSLGNIVVLIDSYTRRAVDSITYDALTKHASVISDIRELNDGFYGSSFVFFDAAVPSIVTPELLEQSVESYKIKPFLIYQLDAINYLFEGVTTVKANYSTIDWNLIYAVINADSAILETYQKSTMTREDLASLYENLPQNVISPVNKMYQSYLALGVKLRDLLSQKIKLEETVAAYRSVGSKTAKLIKELRALFDEVVADNRTYCTMLSESYDVTFNGAYLDRPRTLYIKTISHLSGIDNLLMVLYSVLTKQYKVSCKVVKLVDNTNAPSIRYIPNVYYPLNDTYNTHDVLVNDFIVSLGAFNMLMGQLMLNRSRLDYLIVHDMRGTMNPALNETLVDLQLNEISSDYAVLSEHPNMLSDYAQVPFNWSFLEVAEYTGSSVSKLANHKTVATILEHIM